jgi:hypothetical protein
MLGPLIDLTSSLRSFFLLLISTWSILFVIWSGANQVPLWIFLCWNWVFMTIRLFPNASSNNNSPFLFDTSCNVCFSLTSSYMYIYIYIYIYIHISSLVLHLHHQELKRYHILIKVMLVYLFFILILQSLSFIASIPWHCLRFVRRG